MAQLGFSQSSWLGQLISPWEAVQMGVLIMEHAINTFVAHVRTVGKAPIAANVPVPSATPGATWPTPQITPMRVQNAQIEDSVTEQPEYAHVWMDLLAQHVRE
jgi:hypothetical protein